MTTEHTTLKTLEIRRHGNIAEVVLNRPDQANSLVMDSFFELVAVGEELKRDDQLRAVILRGKGKHFCAGLDMSLFPKEAGSAEWFSEHADTIVDAASGANIFQRCATIWIDLQVPVIAALQGVAFGGGCQLALGADIRVADATTKMSLMETHWGLIPDMGLTQTLPPLMSMDKAAELILTAKIVNAQEAFNLGLVTRIGDDSHQQAFELASEIAEKPPQAIAAAKKLYRAAWREPRTSLLEMEAMLQAQLIGQAEQIERFKDNMKKKELPKQ